MSTDDYEFSGTLTFSDDELKKELHQIALNGLKAFVDAYETVYLGSTNLGNGIKISVEDNTRLPYTTLGVSATDAKELYDLAVAMGDSYEAAKSLCTLETQKDINEVDLVSGITTSISKVKKIADDMGDTLGVTSKKAGIVSSVIGFAGAAIATFDGTTKAEKDALVKSGIDLVGEGLKLGLKAIPGVGLIGSVGIDVGVDLACILAENIYQSLKNSSNYVTDEVFMDKYHEGLIVVDSLMTLVFNKRSILKYTTDDDKIHNYSFGVVINALSGNDNIINDGDNVVIYGGIGNDGICNNFTDLVTMNAGSGDDWINNYGGVNVVIDEGLGNDTIWNHFSYSKKNSASSINGGAGDDYIENEYSPRVTIDGGSGDDTIKSNGGVEVVINGGAGNDYIEPNCHDDDEINVINGGSGNDTITRIGQNLIINGETGDDYINIWGGRRVTVNGGEGDDYIHNEGSGVLINAGSGNDTVYNSSWVNNSTIETGIGDDIVFLDNDNRHSYNIVIQYYNGDGEDIVYGFDTDDTLQITGAKYSSVKSGNDLKIIIGSGSILVYDGADVNFKIEGTLEGGGSSNEILPAGISIKNSIVTAAKTFTGNEINLSNFDATKVNVSALSKAVEIIGNDSNQTTVLKAAKAQIQFREIPEKIPFRVARVMILFTVAQIMI